MTRVIDTSIHGCTSFRVVRAFPGISNSITIGVETDGGARYELTMYGLPPLTTDSLITMFSDENSTLDPKEETAEGMSDAELLAELVGEGEAEDPPQEDDRASV